VAFAFVPHREPFLVAVAGAADEAALADMAAFCDAFAPLLGEVHAWLVRGRGQGLGGREGR
jgi:hypothetical protein